MRLPFQPDRIASSPLLAFGGAILALLLALSVVADGQTLWSIGDPSAEEQLYLEMINRARASPAAEGVLLAAETDPFAKGEYTDEPVNLNLMKQEFEAIAVAPPLAFSEALNTAAANHSADMQLNTFQAHVGSGGSTIQSRAEAAGYAGWAALHENVFSYTHNAWHGHAAFEVDWGGNGSGGMQSGRPHRVVIHNASAREIGVGVVYGQNGSYGPGFVTQDLGRRSAYPSFVTGVVYYDVDGDGFYDLGEGIGGVDVQLPGSGYCATTSASGGYAIPADNGSYTITFSIDTLGYSEGVTISGNESKKVDWTPAFVPSALTGPSNVAVGAGADYAIGEVDGSVDYQVRAAVLDASPEMEGAESGTGAESGAGALSVEQSGTYNVLRTSSTLKKSGAKGFHLAHPSTSSAPQRVTLERLFVPGASGELTFWSRLRWSDEGQWALVEVSADDGATWERVRTQRGIFNVSEGSFTKKTVSLSDYAGQQIGVRFSYVQSTGYLAIGTSASYGWYFDDIEFSDVSEVTSSTLTSVSNDSPIFAYSPPTTGVETLYVRPLAQGGGMPWSAGLQVTASPNDYLAWASRRETQAGLPVGSLADRAGDYDGDGLAQAYEYALESVGLNPTSGSAEPLPTVVEDGGYFVYDYSVDTGKSDATVRPLASVDLGNWFDPTEAGRPEGFEDISLGFGNGTIEFRRARVPAAGDTVYFRLEVTVSDS